MLLLSVIIYSLSGNEIAFTNSRFIFFWAGPLGTSKGAPAMVRFWGKVVSFGSLLRHCLCRNFALDPGCSGLIELGVVF
jgi:hypothetical protein